MKKTSSVAMRHGLDGSGNIVHIDSASRGASCGLFCLSCKRPLVARKGEVKIHSFSHQAKLSNTDIRRCHESYVHFVAKMTISRMGYINLPEGLGCYSVEYGDGQKSRSVTLRKLCGVDKNIRVDVARGEVEKYDYVNSIRPDSTLACSIGGYEFDLNVEIYYTHKVGNEKRTKIKDQGLNCIEINLSGVSSDELDLSIEQRLLDTNFVKIIHLNQEVINTHFNGECNIVSEVDAMNIYIKDCMNSTIKSEIDLPIRPCVDHFTTHSGNKIYHDLLPKNHQGYKCIGGEYGLLFFENNYGGRVNVSIRREANNKAHLIIKDKDEMSYPDFEDFDSPFRFGPLAKEKFKIVSDWITKSALQEIDCYAVALERKLLAAGISIDNKGQEAVVIRAANGSISESLNFVGYYGIDEISIFLSRLDVSDISWRGYSLYQMFIDNKDLGLKFRKIKSLHAHIINSMFEIRTNFIDSSLYYNNEVFRKIYRLKDIVSSLMPDGLRLIRNSQSLKRTAITSIGVSKEQSEHQKRQSELLSKYRDDSL